jgi:hypothetical protein
LQRSLERSDTEGCREKQRGDEPGNLDSQPKLMSSVLTVSHKKQNGGPARSRLERV